MPDQAARRPPLVWDRVASSQRSASGDSQVVGVRRRFRHALRAAGAVLGQLVTLDG